MVHFADNSEALFDILHAALPWPAVSCVWWPMSHRPINEELNMHDTRPFQLDRVAGFALMGGALLAVFFMLHHPSTSSGEIGAALAELQAEGALSAWVHGMLIVVMIGIWFGGYGLTVRLGTRQVLPPLGFLLFGLGTVAYCLAATVSGFIVPRIGSEFANSSPELMEQARGMLMLSGITNQAFANAGLIGTSAGILCWSMALAKRTSWARWAGVFGLIVSVLPALLLLTGQLRLHLTGMTLVVVASSAWYLLIGALLVLGRVNEATNK